MLGKIKKWVSEYSPVRELIVALLALVAVGLQTVEYVKNREEVKIRLEIEQSDLLNQAWDLIGGEEGTGLIYFPTLAAQKNLVQAERLVDKVLVLNPDSSRAFLIKGYINQEALNVPEASEFYVRAAKSKDKAEAAMAHNALANLISLIGNPLLAVEMYKLLIKDTSELSQIEFFQRNLGQTLWKAERYVEAIAIFQELVDKNSLDCGSLTDLGMLQYGILDHLDDAEDNLARAVQLCPDSQRAQMNLGNVYLRKQKYQAALLSYTQASELSKSGYEYDGAYLAIGNVYILLSKQDKAKEAYKKAIEVNSKNASAYLGLAYIAYGKKNYQDAKNLVESALEENDEFQETPLKLDEVYALKTEILIELSEFEEAFLYIDKALKENPNSRAAYIRYPGEAKEAYNKALELNSNDAVAYFRLAYIAYSEKNYKKAKKLIEAALEVNDKFKELPLMLGEVYALLASTLIELGEFEEALLYSSKALEINPNSRAVNNRLVIEARIDLKNEE